MSVQFISYTVATRTSLIANAYMLNPFLSLLSLWRSSMTDTIIVNCRICPDATALHVAHMSGEARNQFKTAGLLKERPG
jgi:hypothetical protein